MFVFLWFLLWWELAETNIVFLSVFVYFLGVVMWLLLHLRSLAFLSGSLRLSSAGHSSPSEPKVDRSELFLGAAVTTAAIQPHGPQTCNRPLLLFETFQAGILKKTRFHTLNSFTRTFCWASGVIQADIWRLFSVKLGVQVYRLSQGGGAKPFKGKTD